MAELHRVTIDGVEYNLPSGGGVPDNIVLHKDPLGEPSEAVPRDADTLGGHNADYFGKVSDVEILESKIAQIGIVYKAQWICSTNNATNIALTQTLTLPKGIYLLVFSYPVCSTQMVAQISGINETSFFQGTTYNSKAVIAEITSETQVKLVSGQSASVTFTYLERGGLVAVKIN